MHEKLIRVNTEIQELKTMILEIKDEITNQLTEQTKIQTFMNNVDDKKKPNRVKTSKEQEDKKSYPNKRELSWVLTEQIQNLQFKIKDLETKLKDISAE